MLNKQDERLLQELLKKYKQGIISGLIQGDNINLTPSGCRNKIISSTGGGGSSYIAPFLKTGGASWSGTGLVYDVTALEYYFNGDKVTSATQVTLDASDPDDNRLDAIVVDESGVISVITGTAASSPITPPIPENQLLVQYILVEAGTTEPVIAKEDIYLENAEWTTSTYTTGTATGSIDFDNAVSPKQGVKCISANADARLGARFVRATSFDPYQYTMLSLWVRFTGSNVATNKSLNVRFENGAGTLVANTINLFNFGLQRNLLNVWQLVVIPITSFGTLPTSVKGLKIIMAGGTVGQARQWDIDLISLTDNSVPSINEQVFNVMKNGILVAQQKTVNFIEGSGITLDIQNDDLDRKVNVTVNSSGGGDGFFPNGYELIQESRDFLQSDVGKLLILNSEAAPIELTMPNTMPFEAGDILGIISTGESHNYQPAYGGDKIFPSHYGNNLAETLILQCEDFTSLGSIKLLVPISTSTIYDSKDNNIKTYYRYILDNLGGGGQIAFTKTKAEIDTLIAGNDLVAGALYEITGVHPTLYNDGTTSGTTIYLRAISGNQLEVQGMGKFYNPKYDKSVDGFGIWDNKMYGTLSNVVGVFDYLNKESVTADNSATGLILADGMIQWVSGDWSVAVSITGSVSGATADVAGFVSPSYGVGDKVIWGGYSWTNVNGNVGVSVDVLNLDAEWTKNMYDTTNYNVAYDLIEYDYANDMIIRRFEKESNVDVKCSKAQFDLFYNNYGFPYHSISVQQFGNVFNTSSFKGQINILCNNGYNESINFIGAYQRNLTFGSNAYQRYLTFGSSASQYNLTFGTNANQRNLTFGSSAYQQNLTFGSGANQYNLTFGSSAYQQNLTFGSDASQGNLTFGTNAYQAYLNFAENTNLDYNNQTVNSNMEYVSFRTKNITVPDLSTATYIYDGNIKEVYQRPDNALKIRYYDNSDVLVIKDIAD